MYHTEPLDFKLTVENQTAVLRYRSLSAADLSWQGPVTLLFRIPPGIPNIIERENITDSKMAAFLQAMNEYMEDEDISGWREYFSQIEENPATEPFCLRNTGDEIGKKVRIPESVVPKELVEIYKPWRDNPWKLYVRKFHLIQILSCIKPR
jgi:hypothetical protein